MEVWENRDLKMPFQSVWGRLERVLRLIQLDNGGNDMVESKRGKRYVELDRPMQPEQQETPPPTAETNEEENPSDLLEDDDDGDYEVAHLCYNI